MENNRLSITWDATLRKSIQHLITLWRRQIKAMDKDLEKQVRDIGQAG